MDDSGEYLDRSSHHSFFKKYLTAKVVIPRSLCIYQRVSCKEIPRLRLKQFATLQIETHSPFNKSGAFTLIQGEWLHLWIWNKDIEDEISKKIYPQDRFHIWPSSLSSKPKNNGIDIIYESKESNFEFQLWKNGLLVDSILLESYPDEATWKILFNNSNELKISGWPNKPPEKKESDKNRSFFLWGKNITPRPEAKLIINWDKISNLALIIASLYIFSWLGWSYSHKLGYQNIINEGIASQEAEIAKFEPIYETRKDAQETIQWLTQIYNFLPTYSFGEIIFDLKENWPRQGYVLRDLEINPPTVQATFVPATSFKPQLTSILEKISANPYFYDARFIDVTGGNGFKFSWRIVQDNNKALKDDSYEK